LLARFLTLYITANGVAWSPLGSTRNGHATLFLFQKYLLFWEYSRINSTKRPALGAGNVSEPDVTRRENARSLVRVGQC